MIIMKRTNWKTALRAVFGTVALIGFVSNSDGARKPAWDTSAAVGFSLTQGNSDTTLLNANIGSKGTYKNYAITLGADATFGEQNDVRNAETYRAFGQYDRKITTASMSMVVVTTSMTVLPTSNTATRSAPVSVGI
jgi:putative salt-induced outer membrane protein YdiY